MSLKISDIQTMDISENLSIKWKEFNNTIGTAFESLREGTDFTDVTLVCEDDHQIEAHKVILAVSSPFFHNILKRNKHQHPLIYMRGMKSENLVAIVDFLYHGETNIQKDNINMF